MPTILDNRIPPPALAIVTGAIMGAASWVMPPVAVAAELRYGVAAVLLLLSGVVSAPAFTAFARAGTTINPVRIDQASALVTGGIYRVTRNPMYVGLTGLLLALAAALARPWLLVGPAFFIGFITLFQIIPEERAMLARFGEPYAAYRRRVRRWL